MKAYLYSEITCLILIVFFAISWTPCECLYGGTIPLESYGKQETELSKKRFESKDWPDNQQSDLTQKTFPFKNWEKYYSSLGSKKWNTLVQEARKKNRLNPGKVEFPTNEIVFSEWQGYLTELESRARISPGSNMWLIQDKHVYQTMLQRAKHYKDTGKLLSLRDINRYQFRRNRPDGEIPFTKAGTGDAVE